MLDAHIDLASVPVTAYQERLRKEARAARRGPGQLRIAIGHFLVRLGELIEGGAAGQAGSALATPAAVS